MSQRSKHIGMVAAIAVVFVLGAALATAVILATSQHPEPDVSISGPQSSGPAESDQAADAPPFYTVGVRTRGPLTLEELQINIPPHIDRDLPPRSRACFFDKVGELAEKAGDPDTLDPADVAFLPTDGTWDELTFFARRSLLAQALISRAATLCF